MKLFSNFWKNVESIYVLLLFLFNPFTSYIYGQVVGSSASGQNPIKEVTASGTTSGGFTGDVSLWNGTYNMSHNLGTVASNSGVSFTANLSYNTTFAGSHTPPPTDGIPYGQGWSIDLPKITYKVEDYNKYVEELKKGLDNGDGNYHNNVNFTDNECDIEGGGFFFSPELHIWNRLGYGMAVMFLIPLMVAIPDYLTEVERRHCICHLGIFMKLSL